MASNIDVRKQNFICAAIRTKATLLMMTLHDAGQCLLARNPMHRQHRIAQMVTGANHCLVPELMPCSLVRTTVQPEFIAGWQDAN